jgi:hypothetical protein
MTLHQIHKIIFNGVYYICALVLSKLLYAIHLYKLINCLQPLQEKSITYHARFFVKIYPDGTETIEEQ